jgi:hypothetical protein
MAFGFGFESLFASSHQVLGSQGPYLCKLLIRGQILDNFIDFLDFFRNWRVFEELERLVKRASWAMNWQSLIQYLALGS